MNSVSIVVCGVGGQGVLTASDIISIIAFKGGYDVKKSEVHGMAQRGGSVISEVRFGEKVYSPLISGGMANYILSFEKLEALRNLPRLKKGGIVICNDYEIKPASVLMGEKKYPDDIEERIKATGVELTMVNGLELAERAGNLRTVNTVLLGALARKLSFSKELWIEATMERVPEKTYDVNRKAFELGYKVKGG